MAEERTEESTQPIHVGDEAQDSAKPDKKAIDDTTESSEERREHPGTADADDN